jgi:hypothetical protein
VTNRRDTADLLVAEESSSSWGCAWRGVGIV